MIDNDEHYFWFKNSTIWLTMSIFETTQPKIFKPPSISFQSISTWLAIKLIHEFFFWDIAIQGFMGLEYLDLFGL